MAVTLPPPPSTVSTSLPNELCRWLYLVYASVNAISSSSGSTGTFGEPGVNTPSAALVPNNTRSLDYLNLTNLALNETRIVATADNINQLFQSNITRNSLASLVQYDSYGHSVSQAQEPETADLISVTYQFFDVNGNNLTVPFNGMMYLSDSSTGIGYTASPPDIGLTTGSNGYFVDIPLSAGSGRFWNFTTDTNGIFNFNIEHTGAATWYMVVIMPYGRVFVSQEITFT